KQIVSGLVAVDMPAAPSEVLIVASGDADPSLVAADLLAQAEHDPDAMCLLVTDSRRFAAAVQSEVALQIGTFEDNVSLKVIRAALRSRGRIFLFEEISRAVSAGSQIAAEHVQVMGRRAERFAPSLLPPAGPLFIGSPPQPPLRGLPAAALDRRAPSQVGRCRSARRSGRSRRIGSFPRTHRLSARSWISTSRLST